MREGNGGNRIVRPLHRQNLHLDRPVSRHGVSGIARLEARGRLMEVIRIPRDDTIASRVSSLANSRSSIQFRVHVSQSTDNPKVRAYVFNLDMTWTHSTFAPCSEMRRVPSAGPKTGHGRSVWQSILRGPKAFGAFCDIVRRKLIYPTT